MKRAFYVFLFLSILVGFTEMQGVRGRSATPQVSLLDRNGGVVDSIVDANEVQLRIRLGVPEDAEIKVEFRSPDLTKPLGECTVQAGADSCETSPFRALGWYWSRDGNRTPQRTISAFVDGNQAIGSLKVSVTPRPVVMVHGFNADYKTWAAYLGPQGFLAELGLPGFAAGDGQVPGVMQTGSITEPLKRTNTIAQNAAILGEYIDHVREATGAETVDLLVHSMGGMISRYYIDRLMHDSEVAQLIILGTPMGGSACSILPASLGMMLPATLEIQPSYMTNVFNQQIIHRQGVPFHALAGTKLVDAVASPCTPVPSDVVVTLDSVRAIPMPVEEIELLHTELNTSREVFAGFVTRQLKTSPDDFEVATDPLPGSNAPVSGQFSRVYTGHLDPGDRQDVVINIDPDVTVANFALFDTSRSLEILVTGASGQRLTLDPVQNGAIRIDDPSTMIYLGYGFRQPRPGRWVVTLETTPTTPASGADYAIAAQFNGGALLRITQDITVARLNEAVTITGNLTADEAAVPLRSASAIVRHPDGSVETLDMEVSGNQAEVKVAPPTSGIYAIEIDVLADSVDGHVIDRAAFLTFEVEPAAQETAYSQLLALGLVAGMVLVIYIIVRRRRM